MNYQRRLKQESDDSDSLTRSDKQVFLCELYLLGEIRLSSWRTRNSEQYICSGFAVGESEIAEMVGRVGSVGGRRRTFFQRLKTTEYLYQYIDDMSPKEEFSLIVCSAQNCNNKNQQTSGTCCRPAAAAGGALGITRAARACECVDAWEHSCLRQQNPPVSPWRILLRYTARQSMAPLSLLGTVVRDKMMKTVTVQVAPPPVSSAAYHVPIS
jgi:hypothetical protein